MSDDLKIFGKNHLGIDGFRVQSIDGTWLIYKRTSDNTFGITQDSEGYLIVSD